MMFSASISRSAAGRCCSCRFVRGALLILLCVGDAVGQEPQQPDLSQQALRDDQLAISGRFSRFERMLSQMADILGREDPERADLLRRAISKGREDRIGESIEAIVELIEKGELGGASEQQTEVIESLRTLLKLLQSEDRRSSVERERERLNALLKDVRGVIAQQKSVRAVTRNAEAPANAAPGQQKAISDSDALLEAMRQHDEQLDGSDRTKPGDTPSTDTEPKQGDAESPNETPPADDRPADAQSPDAPSPDTPQTPETPPSEQPQNGGRPASDDQPKQSGQPSSDSAEPGDSKTQQTPGRKEIEGARKQMQQALEALKEQQRDAALRSEDRAMQQLQEAAAKLEEQLKQLREEEKEMMLASLEARFQRMLAVETQIHEGTVSLAATPQDDWLDQYFSRCRELAQEQSALTNDCAQTASLLREDGTSVSILLAVDDIAADMASVASWLQESNVSDLTQMVQTDILESLKQLIEATQQEMQQMQEEKRQQSQEQNQPSDQKPALVKLMAEIRMLRTLQLQVNRRTVQLNTQLNSAPTDQQAALRKQLKDLAARQLRLIETARELARQAP